MSKQDDQTGEALEDVARIHPVVDRLRDLLSSVTFLDLKASSKGYWASRRDEGERPSTSP
jgi:hypothetical protein